MSDGELWWRMVAQALPGSGAGGSRVWRRWFPDVAHVLPGCGAGGSRERLWRQWFPGVGVVSALNADGRGAGVPAGPGRGLRFDHVSIAVRDLDAAVSFWTERFGLRCVSREAVVAQGVEVASLEAGPEGGRVELVTGPGVERFLDERGSGLHHIAFRVSGLADALAGIGLPPVEPCPRVGTQGRPAAYVHPRTTGGTLVELIEFGPERPGAPAGPVDRG